MQSIEIKENVVKIARLGYASRGVIYLIVGGLAILAALGKGGETTDSKGALMAVMNQPFGDVLMVVLIVGLFSYSTWRFIQSIKDTDRHGMDVKGVAIRGGLLVSSIVHVALAIWAITILMGGSNDSSSQISQNSGGFLEGDSGQLLLAIAGIAVIGVGIAHLIKGWTARFEKYMHIPQNIEFIARPICRFGLIARGVVWCIVGWILINSAHKARAGEVSGMKDALLYIQEAAYGKWLFAIIAVGLFAFGIYSVLEAVYRRVETQTM